jgi:hypothetical protein
LPSYPARVSSDAPVSVDSAPLVDDAFLALQLKKLSQPGSEEADAVRMELAASCRTFVRWRGWLLDWLFTLRRVDFAYASRAFPHVHLDAYAIKHKGNLRDLMRERLLLHVREMNAVWRLCCALGLRIRLDPAVTALNAFQKEHAIGERKGAISDAEEAQTRVRRSGNAQSGVKRKRGPTTYTKHQKEQFKRRALLAKHKG